MSPQPTHAQETALRRASLAGPPGLAGLYSNPRLACIAVSATLGAFCYGYEQGAYSQVLVMPSFTNNPSFSRIATDAAYKGWSVSTLGIGGWFGALLNGFLCDKLSRRWTLFFGGLLCLIATALTTGAQNPAYMFIGRFILGASVGGLSMVVPLYISEISSPETRGTFVAIQQLAITAGICASFWIGFGTNYISDTNSAAWRVCLAGQGVPSILLCVCCLFIPYTPRWLVKKGRFEDALHTLAYLRHRKVSDELVQLEFLEIRAEAMFDEEVAKEKHAAYYGKGGLNEVILEFVRFGDLFSSGHMFRRTAVACLMQFFQQMSGIDCIVYYAPTIFASLGLPGRTVSLLASGVVGVIFVIMTLPAIALIDKIGRRALLFIGGWGMAITLLLCGVLVAVYQDSFPQHQAAAWSTAAFIWLYVGCFGFSWGPVSWVVISEVFPLSVRSYGVALGASTNWMTNFVVSIVVPIMLESITYGTYIFFLAFMLMGLGYVKWVLPETYRRSLEEMDLAFNSTQGAADEQRMDDILRRLKEVDSNSMDTDEKGRSQFVSA